MRGAASQNAREPRNLCLRLSTYKTQPIQSLSIESKTAWSVKEWCICVTVRYGATYIACTWRETGRSAIRGKSREISRHQLCIKQQEKAFYNLWRMSSGHLIGRAWKARITQWLGYWHHTWQTGSTEECARTISGHLANSCTRLSPVNFGKIVSLGRLESHAMSTTIASLLTSILSTNAWPEETTWLPNCQWQLCCPAMARSQRLTNWTSKLTSSQSHWFLSIGTEWSKFCLNSSTTWITCWTS